jgi:hypothetical protein
MFWCVSYYLGSFGTVWLSYETRCKTGRTCAKVCATKSRRNLSQRTYQVHPIRPQTDVLVCFVLFECILGCLVALRISVQNGPIKCKSLWHEVVSQFFATNMPNPPPLDPKLMFWCVSNYLGAFGTVWLPYETRCKMGRTSAKARATKSRRNFSQRTYRLHPIRPQTDVLVRFKLFGCILDRLVALRNSVQNGPIKCKSSCHKVV